MKARSALVGVLGIGTAAFGEVGPGQPLSLHLSNDLVTTYYFRGYQREEAGVIDQPAATLFWKAYRTETLTATLFLGTWNSLHSEQRGRPGGAAGGAWFESDVFVGVDLAFNNFVLTPTYTLYTYPQADFDTVQEFGLRLKYDDSYLVRDGRWPVALQPFIGYYSEFNGSNANTREESTFAEAGIAPEFLIPTTHITITLPIKVGISLDGYYRDSDGDNATFGYASFGLLATWQLPIDPKFGDLRLYAGVDYLQLFAHSARITDGGDSDDWVGRIGISLLY